MIRESMLDLDVLPKIGDEALIRHAYEQVVTYAARLASYATAKPLRTDGPIYDRQELLAIDDLASFAYHSRRLIGFTGTKKRFRNVMIPTVDVKEKVSINSILDIVIHQKAVETIRYEWKLRMLAAKKEELLKIVAEANDKIIPTLIAIQSDKSDLLLLKLEVVIELFQKNVLQKIINVCFEQGLYLEDI